MTRPMQRLAVLGALLVLSLALAPRAEGFVYWTQVTVDPPHGLIARADLDGTGQKSSFIRFSAADAYPRGLALDREHLYWAAPCYFDPPACTSGMIGRANLDGSGVSPDFISGIDPRDVAVDAEGIYWTWSGGIARANLDGSGVEPDFINGIAELVAVDAEHVYWTRSDGELPPTIGRANLDGTGVEPSFVEALPTAGVLTGLALDAAHVYWAAQSFHGPADSGLPKFTIGRAKLDGSGVEPWLIPLFEYPHAIAVDDAHLYWSSYGGPWSVYRANLDGSDGRRLIQAGGYDLAVNAPTVTKAEGRVRAARTQRQTGRRIAVKVKVKAKERLTAKASGKIKLNPSYRLKPKTVKLNSGETKTLKLRPTKTNAKTIAAALKRDDKATARLKVKLTDLAANSESEKLRVKLKR